MPRIARIKSESAVYHIMARSISEVDLFKTSQDKDRYMALVKEYQRIYSFKVYAYCLMDNHLHLIIDANGADISKIMHCINFKYARYFNAIHKRHGHLFQDRFKSKIVNDNEYLIKLTAYVHNNPLDIKGFESCPGKYYYSSLGVYLDLRKDPFEIVDEEFILSILGKYRDKSKQKYMKLVLRTKTVDLEDITEKEVEFKDEETEYRSYRKILVRNFKVEDIIKYVLNKYNIDKAQLYAKYNRKFIEPRAMVTFLLRNLCNLSCKDICLVLGNITSSRVSRLSIIGAELIHSNKKYGNIVNEFIDIYC